VEAVKRCKGDMGSAFNLAAKVVRVGALLCCLSVSGSGQTLSGFTFPQSSENPTGWASGDVVIGAYSNSVFISSNNFDVMNINTNMDTGSVCRVWTVGGVSEVQSFLGYTNWTDGQKSAGDVLRQSAFSQVLSGMVVRVSTNFDALVGSFSNTISGSIHVLDNLPGQTLNTNSSVSSWFGNDVIIPGQGTNQPYNVGTVAAGIWVDWYSRLNTWTKLGVMWVVQLMVGGFLLWSIVDMGIRFMSTKPGDHNFQGSQYATFSQAGVATGLFALILFLFYAACLLAHLGAASVYYGVSLATAGDLQALMSYKLAHVSTTGAAVVPAVSQFVRGTTQSADYGTNASPIFWFCGVVLDWLPVAQLLEAAVFVAVFHITRKSIYHGACWCAAVVAGEA